MVNNGLALQQDILGFMELILIDLKLVNLIEFDQSRSNHHYIYLPARITNSAEANPELILGFEFRTSK